MIVKFKVRREVDRDQIVAALFNAGYKVSMEVKQNPYGDRRDGYIGSLHNEDYYITVEDAQEKIVVEVPKDAAGGE